MFSPGRTSLLVLAILAFSISLLAEATKLSPQITAAATGEKVRVSGPGHVAQIRVQITSPNGALFDSSWKDGNVLDWPIENLADGSYRFSVMVKDLDGVVTHKETALLVLGERVAIDLPLKTRIQRSC